MIIYVQYVLIHAIMAYICYMYVYNLKYEQAYLKKRSKLMLINANLN